MILQPTESIIKPTPGGASCHINKNNMPEGMSCDLQEKLEPKGPSCHNTDSPISGGTTCTITNNKVKPQRHPPVANPFYSCKFTCDPTLKTLPSPIPSDLEYNPEFMEIALNEAWKAFDAKEVPIGAVFVRGGKIVVRVHNLTNEERNATRHCEIIGVDVILRDYKKIRDLRNLEGFVIYVTCEPCVMCASALRMCKIRKVFFGCHNDKFGGLGSVFSLQKQEQAADSLDNHSFTVHGGIMEKRCVNVLRTFYERGNPKLPPNKRHRRTKASEKRLKENLKKLSNHKGRPEIRHVIDENPKYRQVERMKTRSNKDNKRQRDLMTQLNGICSSKCESKGPLDKKQKLTELS